MKSLKMFSPLKPLAIAAVAASALAFGGPASASALHGFCNGTGGNTCVDMNGHTTLGNSTEIGFSSSGSSSVTGTFMLDILLPNDDTAPASFSVTGINGNMGGTATRVGTTAWASGKLADFLSISASPANPIGAYLDSTEAGLNAGATGFFVYQLTLDNFTLPKNSGTFTASQYQFDAISGLGVGSYVLGFLDCGSKGWCATANSGALLVDGTTTSVPEPATLALFAVGLAALAFALGRRRKTVRRAHAAAARFGAMHPTI
ncbi:MAG TPA: PEP-CTERM sorting domain-containing protein [Steroidobacteraceae bacterium]|nr:PEP-CTERM sorting domain-containing protein [Steroidobacteraceae bacterium]